MQAANETLFTRILDNYGSCTLFQEYSIDASCTFREKTSRIGSISRQSSEEKKFEVSSQSKKFRFKINTKTARILKSWTISNHPIPTLVNEIYLYPNKLAASVTAVAPVNAAVSVNAAARSVLNVSPITGTEKQSPKRRTPNIIGTVNEDYLDGFQALRVEYHPSANDEQILLAVVQDDQDDQETSGYVVVPNSD